MVYLQTLDGRIKPELTCISEEGIADMDLPDHLLEELDYLGDCITSCDKVENYLMRSEYENNLIVKSGESMVATPSERRHSRLKRTFSIRQPIGLQPAVGDSPRLPDDYIPQAEPPGAPIIEPPATLPPEVNHFNKLGPQRRITVIEEASV